MSFTTRQASSPLTAPTGSARNSQKTAKSIEKGKTDRVDRDKILASRQQQFNSLLPIVKLRIEIDNLIYGQLHALLDTGAQPNIITAEAVRQLKMPMAQIRHKMIGIDGRPFNAKAKVMARIKPWFDSNEFIDIEFIVLPNDNCWTLITTPLLIEPPTDSSRLANPDYRMATRAHAILGVATVARCLLQVMPREVSNIPMLETIFGIVIYGPCANKNTTAITHTITELTENEQLDRAIAKLWQLDQLPDAPKKSAQERLAEQIFIDNLYRDADGRYNVAIPLKPNVHDIGDSRKIALQRFFAMERKLERDPELRQKYVDFMTEYKELGHMREVNETAEVDEIVYYIPHHAILPRFRVVFDGSCKTDLGISLNDIQLIGGKEQFDLADIIMRFRRHPIAVTADIRMMFRQVRVEKKFWNLQRIFWRKDRNEILREYWLTVVTYGLASSAHSAVRALIQCGREAEREFPTAANIIMKDFYMDDLLTGADSESEAIHIAKQIYAILHTVGFELRKWQSNSESIRTAMKTENGGPIILSEDNTTILGLKWNPVNDTFSYTVKMDNTRDKKTKRIVLSKIAQLYDPQGYIGTVTIVGRMIMQDIWKAKIDWDSQLPKDIEKKWTEFWKDIRQLEKLKIPRWIGTRQNSEIHLHGFADASSKAYGAVIYVQVRQHDDSYKTILLVSKSRVVNHH